MGSLLIGRCGLGAMSLLCRNYHTVLIRIQPKRREALARISLQFSQPALQFFPRFVGHLVLVFWRSKLILVLCVFVVSDFQEVADFVFEGEGAQCLCFYNRKPHSHS